VIRGETIEECALREVEERNRVKGLKIEKFLKDNHSFSLRGNGEVIN